MADKNNKDALKRVAKKTAKKWGSRRRKRSAIPLFILILLAIAALCMMLVLDLAGIVDFFKLSKRPTYTVTGGTVEIHMINMGQGDSILVLAPEGNILFDAGKDTTESESAVSNYLDNLGIERLDYVVFTHPDEDHIGGADMIIRDYTVGTVFMEKYTYADETSQYTELVAELDKKGIEPYDPAPNYEFTIGELHLKVLGPVGENSTESSEKNNNSIVMRLDFGESSFLMTGDAEKKAEDSLLETYSAAELDCDVLKVGHHGSNGSSSKNFLEAVTPEISIISCKAGNKYNHPGADTLERLEKIGSEIYRTDEDGHIVLVSDGTDIKVKSLDGVEQLTVPTVRIEAYDFKYYLLAYGNAA